MQAFVQMNCESILNFKISSIMKIFEFLIKFYIEQIFISTYFFSNCTYNVARVTVTDGTGCGLI
jgi:hypothetical protein